mgnify:CR=1 FL=1
MNLGISGRTALVVGASRGIGMEIARELWSEGCKVISVARTLENGEATRRVSIQRDLMPDGAPEKLAAEIIANHGAPDMVVHVLGGSQGITQTLAPSSDWAKVWRLNLGIAHDLNCAFIPEMQRNRWGRIVHISSNTTRIGTGYCPYSSAKAALDGYVKIVSKEVSKDGVIITAVAPGIVHTPGRYYASLDSKAQEEYFNQYIPIARFGRAEEVARVVAFLSSDHASYMAGSIVQIDGGAR